LWGWGGCVVGGGGGGGGAVVRQHKQRGGKNILSEWTYFLHLDTAKWLEQIEQI
jgi:hypothetical protein